MWHWQMSIFNLRYARKCVFHSSRYDSLEYIYVVQICSTVAGAIGWRLSGCCWNICTSSIDTITLHWSVSVLWPYHHSTYDKLFSKCIRRCYLQLVNWYISVGWFPKFHLFMCISFAMLDIFNHFSFLPCAMHFFSYRNWIYKNSQERGTQSWMQQEFVWRVSISTNFASCAWRKKYVMRKYLQRIVEFCL